MEMKSVSDCLNKIDEALAKNIGKYIGISDLENFFKFLLKRIPSDFIENRVALSNVLSQIRSIVENYYQVVEEDIRGEYIQLRKLILVWLLESSTGPEVDDQQ